MEKENKITEFEYGYLAGIIEGEGCFSIGKSDNSLDVNVQVSSNDIQLIKWLKQKFGGNIYMSEQYFSWIAYKDDILIHLKKIVSKLLFKKQQCETFIRLCEMLQPKHIGISIGEDENKDRASLIQLHKYLIQNDKVINKAGRNNDKIIVSLSGGLDSTTMIYYLIQKGLKPECVSFDYNSKHNQHEIKRAKEICKLLNLKHDVINLGFVNEMFDSALLKKGGKIPEGHYESSNQKQTVVPNRNMIMLSILTGLAESRKIKFVAFGAHANDFAIYPDCRPEFAASLNSATRLGTYLNVGVISPFINYTKSDIVFLGKLINVPFEKTWSCYNPINEKSCGKCGTCTERIIAFYNAEINDTIEYVDGWDKSLNKALEVEKNGKK